MDTKASYVAAGSFVILLAIGLVFFIIYINRIDWTQGKKYDIYFSGSITGLREKEIVSFNGVPIGRVEKIEIDPDKLNLIRVVVEIDEPENIRENSYATLEAKGITGSVQVIIRGSTSESPVLTIRQGQVHPVIRSKVSPFQTVIQEAPVILCKLEKLIDDVAPLFNEENRNAISSTLKNVDKLSSALAKESKDLDGFFDQTQKTMKRLEAAGHKVDDAMTQLDQFIAENRPYIYKFTSSSLQNADKLMSKIESMSDTIDRVMQKFEPNPVDYLFYQGGQGENIEE